MLLLLFLSVLALTAAAILLLHRLQLKNREESVDRSAPLAAVDLDFSSGAATRTEAEPGPAYREAAETSPEKSPERTPTASTSAQPPQGTPTQVTYGTPTQEVLPVSFIPRFGTPTKPVLPESFIPKHGTPTQSASSPTDADELDPHADEADTWLLHAKALREEAKYEAALALCRENYPRIQAFQQSGVILRQQIREQIEQHRPVADELQELYRIAVLADLYRSSNPFKPKNPALTLQALRTHDFDYQSIGTRLLRLLTKSDIRHLEQLWGRPASHRHAEQVLGPRWNELCL